MERSRPSMRGERRSWGASRAGVTPITSLHAHVMCEPTRAGSKGVGAFLPNSFKEATTMCPSVPVAQVGILQSPPWSTLPPLASRTQARSPLVIHLFTLSPTPASALTFLTLHFNALFIYHYSCLHTPVSHADALEPCPLAHSPPTVPPSVRTSFFPLAPICMVACLYPVLKQKWTIGMPAHSSEPVSRGAPKDTERKSKTAKFTSRLDFTWKQAIRMSTS